MKILGNFGKIADSNSSWRLFFQIAQSAGPKFSSLMFWRKLGLAVIFAKTKPK